MHGVQEQVKSKGWWEESYRGVEVTVQHGKRVNHLAHAGSANNPQAATNFLAQ